jgi:putative acetyltransferase
VETWRKRIADRGADDHLLVAEVDGIVVGNLGLHPASSSPRRRHAGLIGMSVRDDWHGKGVGRALLAAALDLADNWLNYRRLELTVYTDNLAAQALYRSCGFEVEGTHREFAFRDGHFVDALAMARLRPGVTPPATAGTAGGQMLAQPHTTVRKATKIARKRGAAR